MTTMKNIRRLEPGDIVIINGHEWLVTGYPVMMQRGYVRVPAKNPDPRGDQAIHAHKANSYAVKLHP